jgi:hypothetical protein
MSDRESTHGEQDRSVVTLVAARPNSGGPTYYTFLSSARWLWIVYLLLGGVEGFILIRLAIRAASANPDSSFVSFIYTVTGPMVFPFHGVLAEPLVQGAVIDVASFVALVVYICLGWAITRILWLRISGRQS